MRSISLASLPLWSYERRMARPLRLRGREGEALRQLDVRDSGHALARADDERKRTHERTARASPALAV